MGMDSRTSRVAGSELRDSFAHDAGLDWANPITREHTMKRGASALWKGGLKDGKGRISTRSGVRSNARYGFATVSKTSRAPTPRS